MEILAYLAYETVAQVREYTDWTLVKQNELITRGCTSASGDCVVSLQQRAGTTSANQANWIPVCLSIYRMTDVYYTL